MLYLYPSENLFLIICSIGNRQSNRQRVGKWIPNTPIMGFGHEIDFKTTMLC